MCLWHSAQLPDIPSQTYFLHNHPSDRRNPDGLPKDYRDVGTATRLADYQHPVCKDAYPETTLFSGIVVVAVVARR